MTKRTDSLKPCQATASPYGALELFKYPGVEVFWRVTLSPTVTSPSKRLSKEERKEYAMVYS